MTVYVFCKKCERGSHVMDVIKAGCCPKCRGKMNVKVYMVNLLESSRRVFPDELLIEAKHERKCINEQIVLTAFESNNKFLRIAK
ncbi:MAG: hypothetical protein BWY47_01406 [Bacteroidetes bacterium ADurb.Bin302]|nr:MAG: hypothetical protein BWY47_01406 [Bacteroidetes bacterium ADurb.Bin302]